MNRFELRYEWISPEPEDDALPVEEATWARLEIRLDGRCVTSNHPADTVTPEGESHSVVGAASGLAEWFVDHWLYLLWELHTPFPKHRHSSGPHAVGVPGLRDALRGWPEWLDGEADAQELGRWQARHTLGAARSDLALPSLVFLPEDAIVGVTVDHPPTYQLDSTVRFSVQEGSEPWPAGPYWVPKDELTSQVETFVDDTLEHARDASDEAARNWAMWLARRWEDTKSRARDPHTRLRIKFGEFVAARWEALEQTLGDRISALSGLLSDSPLIEDDDHLEHLSSQLQAAVGAATASLGEWRSFTAGAIRGEVAPYEQGYQLAKRVRTQLGAPKEPLNDLRRVLEECAVDVREVESRGLYRSAAVALQGGYATVLQATDDERNQGVAPARFAIAAAFGRLIADAPLPLQRQAAFGAAQSDQSRWMAAQRANAFAAELLLPAEALPGRDLQDLCETYGISRSAATWHRHNRLGSE